MKLREYHVRSFESSLQVVVQGKATTKDQTRNISICAWMFRKHLDYVSQFNFHATNKDNEKFNKKLELLWADYSKKDNCDIARRHNLPRIIRMYEAGKVIDGDCGLYKLSDGKLQGIEGSRIAKAMGGSRDSNINEHGLVLDKFGAVSKYSIVKSIKNRQVFEKLISYNDLIFDGYFTRFNQTRGISPLASALNIFQDLYESWEYALLKAKMHAMFGVAITSDSVSSTGDGFNQVDSYTGGSPTSDTKENGYEFKLKHGLKLELDPGDKIDTIESKTPSTEFKDYTELMIRVGMLALDIPYTFFDSKQSSFSSMKQDRTEYEQSAKTKKEANQETLNNIADWKHQEWIDKGIITEFKNVRDIKYSWRASGRPWLEELKEVSAADKRVSMGLSSLQLEAKIRGYDWFELMEQREIEQNYLRKHNIQTTIGMPGQSTVAEKDKLIEEDDNE